MTKENPQPPWQRVIICGPGDTEAIKKAGEDSRNFEEGLDQKKEKCKIWCPGMNVEGQRRQAFLHRMGIR